MGDDDRNKKSWRERDAAANRSRHTRRDDERKPTARAQQASSAYKKDLEALFKPGGGVPDRFKSMTDKLKPAEGSEEALWREAIRELAETEGFREFTMAARKFVRAGHKLPDDEDLLVRLLDVPDETALQAVLKQILDMERRGGFGRKAPIKNRLTTMRSVAEDPRTIELLDEIAKIL